MVIKYAMLSGTCTRKSK